MEIKKSSKQTEEKQKTTWNSDKKIFVLFVFDQTLFVLIH